MTIRPIAIHLPQFHPIPENDEWWGKGFTEWHNVTRARPKFRGHHQPHLPADLGFYDLRLAEVRAQQAELARAYGVYGFCYYHYWFSGRRLLQRPVQEILKSGEPDFPFMLCWANENWTRTWSGGKNSVLLGQTYTEADHRAHIEALIPYFQDRRYIRVEGKPVFSIYKDADIPNLEIMIEIFRTVAQEHGLELFLTRFRRRLGTRPEHYSSLGFDSEVDFQPLSETFNKYSAERIGVFGNKYRKLKKKAIKKVFRSAKLPTFLKESTLADNVYSYSDYVDFDIRQAEEDIALRSGEYFPGVCPGWDNTSRRQNGGATIFKGSTPEFFEDWVHAKVKNFVPRRSGEDFLFINAWNEWAEGNHLEPCQLHGHSYLEALRRGVELGLTERKIRSIEP